MVLAGRGLWPAHAGEGAAGAAAPGELPLALKPWKTWDFSKAVGAPSEWRFYANSVEKSTRGYVVRLEKNGALLRNDKLNFRALDVSAIEVEIAFPEKHGRDAAPLRPKEIRMYWARGADVERSKEWPFDGERSVRLRLIPGKKQVWRGDISMHGNWIGSIRDAMISVNLPDAAAKEAGPVEILVAKVVFLAEDWKAER